jgi:hypothetical protein
MSVIRRNQVHPFFESLVVARSFGPLLFARDASMPRFDSFALVQRVLPYGGQENIGFSDLCCDVARAIEHLAYCYVLDRL